MGRELQKKKNRSSVPKIRQKPKSKKLHNPRGNAIIAANWDKALSIAQNYRQLGLTSRLNHRTGGVDKHHRLYQSDLADEGDDALAIGGKKNAKLDLEEVSVVKDPKTGKILEVVGGKAEARRQGNPLNDPLNDLEEEYDDKIANGGKTSNKAVVHDLEALAARGEEKRPRKQSQREQEWIERLVRKHGTDYRAMSRDTKLNPMQQSQGDIKARVTQWKQYREQKTEDQMELDNPQHVEEAALVAPKHIHKGEFDNTEPLCNCKLKWEDYYGTVVLPGK